MPIADCRLPIEDAAAAAAGAQRADGLILPCVACGGRGDLGFDRDGPIQCPACQGSGDEPGETAGCPMDWVTADVWETIELAEHAEAGTWPAAGGILDQTANFVAASQYISSRKAHHETQRLEAMKRMLRG